MKTLVILILLLVLIAGAALSRPSEQSFRTYLSQNINKPDANILEKTIGGYVADRYFESATYQNRLVYATITRSGRIEYVGAFGRWFRWAEGELTISPAP